MVKEKQKPTVATTEKRLYERVESLPESDRKKTGVYSKLLSGIAKEKKGTYKITLANLDVKSTKIKSVYPSLEKAMQSLAKQCKVDFSVKEKKTFTSDDGKAKTRTTYPQYNTWKQNTMRIRVRKGELYIEKLTDKPLP